LTECGSLLGMSFLERLNYFEFRDRGLIQQR
jgi:predicted aspartyl protease